MGEDLHLSNLQNGESIWLLHNPYDITAEGLTPEFAKEIQSHLTAGTDNSTPPAIHSFPIIDSPAEKEQPILQMQFLNKLSKVAHQTRTLIPMATGHIQLIIGTYKL